MTEKPILGVFIASSGWRRLLPEAGEGGSEIEATREQECLPKSPQTEPMRLIDIPGFLWRLAVADIALFGCQGFLRTTGHYCTGGLYPSIGFASIGRPAFA